MSGDEREREERLIAGVKDARRGIEPISGARERVWEAARKEIALARAGRGRRRMELILPIAAAILILFSTATLVWIHEADRGAGPATTDSDWGMWGKKPSGNFYTAGVSIEPPLETLWRYATEGLHSGKPSQSPVTAAGRVFTTKRVGMADRVVALDAATGEEKWVSSEPTEGFLAADGRCTYAMAKSIGGSAAVTALDASDGTERWKRVLPARGTGFWHPILMDDIICVGADGLVAALDAHTGNTLWTLTNLDTDTPGCCRPVACGCSRHVYLVTDAGALQAIEISTGATKWSTQLGPTEDAPLDTLVAVGKGRVYALQVSGEPDKGPAVLSCHDGSDGSAIWRVDTKSAMYLVAAGDMVYTKGMDLTAFRAADGRRGWSRSLGTCAPITCAGDGVYVMDQRPDIEPELVALSAGTGKELWKSPVTKSCVGLILTGKTGFLAGLDGMLRAVRLSTSGAAPSGARPPSGARS